MSSFICSPETFNSVENQIPEILRKDMFNTGVFRDVMPELYRYSDFTDKQRKQKISELMDALRELNAVCVSLQYRHHYEGKLDNEIQTQTAILLQNKRKCRHLNVYGVYKQLQCITYQIEPEHLTNLRDLTEIEAQALEFAKIMKTQIAHYIIQGLEAYDSEPWGID